MTTAASPNSSYARRCSLVAVNHTEIQMLSGRAALGTLGGYFLNPKQNPS